MSDVKMTPGVIDSIIKGGVGIVAVVALSVVFLRLGEIMLDKSGTQADLTERQIKSDERSSRAQEQLSSDVHQFLMIWSGAVARPNP
jgi:hypothetical protein